MNQGLPDPRPGVLALRGLSECVSDVYKEESKGTVQVLPEGHAGGWPET